MATIIYTVNVGNIGNIEYTNFKDANKAFREYVNQSTSNYGRAAGESVYLLSPLGDIIKEHIGEIDNTED